MHKEDEKAEERTVGGARKHNGDKARYRDRGRDKNRDGCRGSCGGRGKGRDRER